MIENATFAAGCFWCMEPPFERLAGVIEVIAGYTGGHKVRPTYEQVSSGKTGHLEAIRVRYDDSLIKYPELLDVFWENIDPTDETGQFADKGPQYKTAIFYHNLRQKHLAEESKNKLQGSGKFNAPIVTRIIKAGRFYKAQGCHQDYYKTNPQRYEAYRDGSGRAAYLKKMRDKDKTTPRPEDLKKRLTPLQYRVTQECGTEPPFKNKYWDNKRDGIYVGIVSGEPLFISFDKFDSGTGWPSFTKPLNPEDIVEKDDRNLLVKRIEVSSKKSGSHLGHVFDDGPGPTGRRYCINSAALRFIPKQDLEKEGYGQYRELFRKPKGQTGGLLK